MKKGFTLIELMIVVAIIAALALIAVPKFMTYLHKSKRAEVYINLGALHTAEKAYYAEHNKYSNVLAGEGGIGWSSEGQIKYSYGFAGQEGVNYFKGSLEAPIDLLGRYSKIEDNSFVIAAIADIDGDGTPDVITINDKREIKIVQDDLV
jgi:prepilin-type N-terminal cleavage/methylation domain-containing protein